MGPRETNNSEAKHAALRTQNHRLGLGTIETCNSGPKFAVLHAENTDEGWDP